MALDPTIREIPQAEVDNLLNNGTIISNDVDAWIIAPSQIFTGIVILSLIIGGIVYAGARGDLLSVSAITAPTSSPRPQRAIAEQPTREPTKTLRPTDIPSPTRDYVREAELAFVITEQAATQIAIDAQIEQDRQNSVKTQAAQASTEAAAATYSAATATSVGEMAALNLAANKTAIVESATRQSARQKVEIDAAQAKANIETIGSAVAWVVGIFVLCVIAALGIVKLSTAFTERAALRPIHGENTDPGIDFLENMQPAQTYQRAYIGGLSMKNFANIATLEQLQKIAQGIRDGVSLTHDNWTPEKTALLSEGKFASLQHILINFGRARWVDESNHTAGIELTEDGYKFFDDVLTGKLTPSPLQKQAAENQNPPSIGPIDDGFHPL